jgi:hypothetical protein
MAEQQSGDDEGEDSDKESVIARDTEISASESATPIVMDTASTTSSSGTAKDASTLQSTAPINTDTLSTTSSSATAKEAVVTPDADTSTSESTATIITNTSSITSSSAMMTISDGSADIIAVAPAIAPATPSVITDASAAASEVRDDTAMNEDSVMAESNDPAWMVDASKYLLSIEGQGENWEKLVRDWMVIERQLKYPDGSV